MTVAVCLEEYKQGFFSPWANLSRKNTLYFFRPEQIKKEIDGPCKKIEGNPYKKKKNEGQPGLLKTLSCRPLILCCVKNQMQKRSHSRCSVGNSSSFAFELNHSHSHIASIKETVSDIIRCCALLQRNIERPDIFILRSNSSCDSSLRTVTQIRIFCFGHHFCADLSVNLRLRTRWEGKSCFRRKTWKTPPPGT